MAAKASKGKKKTLIDIPLKTVDQFLDNIIKKLYQFLALLPKVLKWFHATILHKLHKQLVVYVRLLLPQRVHTWIHLYDSLHF